MNRYHEVIELRKELESKRINKAELSMKSLFVVFIVLGLILFFGGGR